MALPVRRVRRALTRRRFRRRLRRYYRKSMYIRRPRNGGNIVRMRFAFTQKMVPNTGQLRYYLRIGLHDIAEATKFLTGFAYYRQWLWRVRVTPKFNANHMDEPVGTYIMLPCREDISWDKAEAIEGDAYLTKPHSKVFRITQEGHMSIKPAVSISSNAVPSGSFRRLMFRPWVQCGSNDKENIHHLGLLTVFPSDLSLKTVQFLLLARVYVHFKTYSL